MQSVAKGRVSVGHPVDVASGTLFHEFEDYTLPGRMPLIFARRYSSALSSQLGGMFGPGWSSPFEMRLLHDLEGYRMIAEDGETQIEFDDPEGIVESGGMVRNLGAFHEIRREGDNLVVIRWNPDSEEVIHYIFPKGKEGQWSQLSRRLDVEGQGVEIERDSYGRIIKLKQLREKRGYRLIYNKDGRVIEVYLTTPVREIVDGYEQVREKERLILRYNYDTNGLLAVVIDAAEHRCSYEYDAVRHMIREVTFGGMVYEFKYDTKGRCIQTTGANDFGLTRLEFFATERKTLVTNSLGNVTIYECNANGQVERETSPLGHTKMTVFDDRGRVAQEVTPEGTTTSYVYDERGDRAEVTSPTGAVTKYVYNEHHQVAAITDPAGNIWQREYDYRGQVVKVINPSGGFIFYEYDGRGDLTAVQDALGNRRQFEWSEFGNLASATDFLGHRTTYEVDDEGRLIGIVDPKGYHTEAHLDALGRIDEVRLPDGAKRRFHWDAYDQPTKYVDELGNVTQWKYHACGLLSEVIRPHGGKIQFDWSPIPEQLIGVVNERGERYQFEYDSSGRLVRETDFSGKVTKYEYDKNDQVIATINAAGQRTEVARDKSGAVTQVSHSDGSKINYEYDVRGLLIKADNRDCVVERVYDAVGRLIKEKQGKFEIESLYDSVGNRIHRKSSLGHNADFAWNPNGQIAQINLGKHEPIQFAYDERQDEVLRSFNGVRIAQEYDNRGRRVEQRVGDNLSSWTNKKAETSLIYRKYSYDPASNLTEIYDKNLGSTLYAYDPVSRIVNAQLPAGLIERLVYDAADNVTSIGTTRKERTDESKMSEQVENCAYEKGNRLIQKGNTIYKYDELGQLIFKQDEKGSTTYHWNLQGQLTSVTLPDSSEWKYRYDVFSRRIQKIGPKSKTTFVWDGDVVLHEIYEDTSPTQEVEPEMKNKPRINHWEFDPDGFAPVAKIDGDKLYISVNDPAGNPRELIQDNDTIGWKGTYKTFGEVDVQINKVDCPVRLQGQWHDEETGLYYNRFRYYDPQVGRYITLDPIGLYGGLNFFMYAPNTTGWIDPYGLTKRCPASKKPIKEGEVTSYEDFVNRSVIGDKLEGHELWQHANLKAKGLATTRLSTEASMKNPVVALKDSQHKAVNKAQRSIDATSQTARENIEANARILRQQGVPQKVVNKAVTKSVKHAQNLGQM